MKCWKMASSSLPAVEKLALELHLSPLIATLLVNRNLAHPDEAHAFLFHTLKNLPDPFLMKDMNGAVNRIVEAMRLKEKITIYGDYDVDGTTGTSMLILFFRELGYEVDFYIPHRLREGYSLNVPALQTLAKKGTKVLITVDNGISAIQEANACRELGIDLIITDHHLLQEGKPDAHAVINPHQSDCLYPAKEICGTGVAFNLMMGLRQKLRDAGFFKNRPEPDLKKYLDLVALATVADVMPLRGVNRVFVKYGLRQMAQTVWPGLKALKEVAQMGAEIDASHLGFCLGPRLNACGRLKNASTGVKLLTTTSQTEAITLAHELNATNRERQSVEDSILTQALALIAGDAESNKRASLVLYHESWHPGVVGIVASRLVDRLGKPAILFGRDGENLKGSARSVGDLHLYEVLKECGSLLLKCGGHRAAAGLSLNIENLNHFSQVFDERVKLRLTEEDLVPILKVEAELKGPEITFELRKTLEQLEPFGMGNPEPVFCMRGVEVQNRRFIKEKHIKFIARKGDIQTEAMAFNMVERELELRDCIDLAFRIGINSYLGQKSLVLYIRDFKVI